MLAQLSTRIGIAVAEVNPQYLNFPGDHENHVGYRRNALVDEADLILLLTEWREYLELDPQVLERVVAHRRILDGRNVLDPTPWRAAGWVYRALGRP